MSSDPTVPDARDKPLKHELLGEWSAGADFVTNVVAGLLLGLFLDWWWGTGPWMVVAGILLGVYAGWRRMQEHAKKIDSEAEEAMRKRRGLS